MKCSNEIKNKLTGTHQHNKYLLQYIALYTPVVLSYLNDGLTSIKFSREKTLELMVEFRCHRPTRFGKSNYSKDARIRRTIV